MRDKWIAALRSGKYGQTKGRLKRGENYFCCLGVACDISGAGHWESNNDYYYLDAEDFVSHTLNSRLKAIFGLTNTEENEAISMNEEGRTFEEIADYLERGLNA